jgi:hypothetical protein
MSARFRVSYFTLLALPTFAMLQVSSGCSQESGEAPDSSATAVIPGASATAPFATNPAMTGEVPAGQTPVGETPAETPVGETPAETPVGETPAETPVGETPAGETPAETPVGETPAETPVGETLVGETPVGETPVGETPVGETPVGETPAETPVGETPAETPVGETPAEMPDGDPVACPEFTLPSAQDLQYDNDALPNPFEFKFMDLPDVTTKALWECRRQEISAMAQEYLYGHMPDPAEATVTGSVNGGTIQVNVEGPAGTGSFSVSTSGSGDMLMIQFGGGWAPSGARTASLNPSSMISAIQDAYGSTDVGTNMASAWGLGRIIDVLEQNPDSGIDPTKLMTTGCSTNGKQAAIAAAFEPRVGIGMPVESGACGAVSWRVGKAYGGDDSNNDCQDIEHLEQNWLGGPADPFRNGQVAITKLPFDQHEVLALRAPHPMMVINNSKDWMWLCSKGNVAAAQGAHAIYAALGAADNFGFHESESSHGHCQGSHGDDFNAFVDKFFNGNDSANTSIMIWHNDSDERDTWIDWTLPELP